MHLWKTPSSPNDMSAKEEILQSKNERFDWEERALMHLCKKPHVPKDMSSKEEILQNKGRLSVAYLLGEV
eukprot:8676562-Ditylum_brightwellii.AAC.1